MDGITKGMKATGLHDDADFRSLPMPDRPGRCTGKKGVDLATNHLVLVPGLSLNHNLGMYNIIIFEIDEHGNKVLPKKKEAKKKGFSAEPNDPEDHGVKGGKRTQIIKLYLAHLDDETRARCVTNFVDILVTTKPLDPKYKNVTIPYKTEEQAQPRPNAKRYTIQLDIKHTINGEKHVKKLIDAPTSSCASSDIDNKVIFQALNIWLHHWHLTNPDRFASVGSSRCFSLAAPKTMHGSWLGMRTGYFSSIRKGDHLSSQPKAPASLLINVGLTSAAFFEHMRVVGPDAVNTMGLVQLCDFMYNEDGYSYVDIESRIKGLLVMTDYLRDGNHVIRRRCVVRGFAHHDDGRDENGQRIMAKDKRNPASFANSEHVTPTGCGFWLDSDPVLAPGRYTVREFFRRKYSHTNGAIDDEDPRPVVNVGTKQKPQYVPMELCTVMPNQPYRAQLSPAETTDMLNIATVSAAAQTTHVRNGYQVLGLDASNSRTRNFNMTVYSSLLTLKGLQLMRPDVRFAAGNMKKTNQRPNPSWDLRQTKLIEPVTKVKFSVLLVGTRLSVGDGRAAMVSLRNHWKGHGIMLADGSFDVQQCANNQVQRHVGQARKNQDPSCLNLLVVVLPKKDPHAYGEIKRVAEMAEKGSGAALPTVCLDSKNLTRGGPRPPYASNVALKVNLKLGGQNHKLEMGQEAKYAVLRDSRTMIIGLDVTHPPPGAGKTAKSLAGLVYSIEPTYSQWPAIVRVQTVTREEMVGQVGAMFDKALTHWSSVNGNKLPERILFYRDGVSEGQYHQVLDREVSRIQDNIKTTYKNKDLPKITVVVVGKRHHVRFYNKQTSDHNPAAGLVVDTCVTERGTWDFYLQSHTALKGTARPGHYFVVLDEIFGDDKNAADNLVAVTQALCYTFGRATCPVGIVTPAYYADIACTRAKAILDSNKRALGDQQGATWTGDIGEMYNSQGKKVPWMFYI